MHSLYFHKMTKACERDERRVERRINGRKRCQEDGGAKGGWMSKGRRRRAEQVGLLRWTVCR